MTEQVELENLRKSYVHDINENKRAKSAYELSLSQKRNELEKLLIEIDKLEQGISASEINIKLAENKFSAVLDKLQIFKRKDEVQDTIKLEGLKLFISSIANCTDKEKAFKDLFSKDEEHIFNEDYRGIVAIKTGITSVIDEQVLNIIDKFNVSKYRNFDLDISRRNTIVDIEFNNIEDKKVYDSILQESELQGCCSAVLFALCKMYKNFISWDILSKETLVVPKDKYNKSDCWNWLSSRGGSETCNSYTFELNDKDLVVFMPPSRLYLCFKYIYTLGQCFGFKVLIKNKY